MKKCPLCSIEKPLEEFPVQRARKDGRSSYCKACDSDRKKEWRKENRDRYNEYMREYKREWRKRNPHLQKAQDRRTDLKRKYGITVDDYDAMLEAQMGCCAICGRGDADSRGYSLVVDHCHDSDAVRGLLCSPCNMGIGQLGDDLQRLRSAVAYLERYESSE